MRRGEINKARFGTEEIEMFTGTLIEDLMSTVERAEQHARKNNEAEMQITEHWHGIASYELSQSANNLLGVA
jgi:hypothetical protein